MSSDVVIETSPDLLVLETGRVDEAARERFDVIAGPAACISNFAFDRPVPTQAELEAMAAELAGGSGLVGSGAAYLGGWLEAARAFGAMEAYVGRPKPWYLVAPASAVRLGATNSPDALVLVSLDPFPISGGRTIWYPGFYGGLHASSSNCPPPSAGPTNNPEARTIDCGAGASVDVTVADHVGVAANCVVSTGGGPDEYVQVTNTGSDPTRLEVRWQLPSSCVEPAEIELWSLDSRGEFMDRLAPNYVIGVRLLEDTRPHGCFDTISSQAVVLTLTEPIDASDVEVFLIDGAVGVDRNDPPDSDFNLTITAGGFDLPAEEPIEVAASVTYTGDSISALITGFVGPTFGFEQLDGDLRLDPAGHLLLCPDPLSLRREVPLTRTFAHPLGWPSDHPDAAFLDRYMYDGRLRLPAGTYLVYAASRFSVSHTCTSDQVELRAGIIIQVR